MNLKDLLDVIASVHTVVSFNIFAFQFKLTFVQFAVYYKVLIIFFSFA